MNVTHTLVAMTLVGATALPAAAQSTPTPNARYQVRTMETIFVRAIANGVDQIAQRLNEALPGIPVASGTPHAHGYQVENYGWFFDVEVPEIRTATIDLYVELQRPRVPASGRVNTGVAGQSAPMPVPSSPVIEDPQREYRKAIRESLTDAILDFGQMPLRPAEFLTVGARAADPPTPALAGEESMALVLSITGADLAEFRAGKITRDEARTRIKVTESKR